ncbi:hypothetical protein QNI16_15370 [Cytophagaceae bacterium YF14B1]|uniref:Uncharacterized protein n=1 Tax=Xanthocytophaga flava TaxID=3048013 RepID=A0AAE3QQY4_9BACT|nr:hypothetical protein [Xanthocytophaga flavus]MDJ1481880.1 hypothetical protein [Xanthocytophaga flavus]
MKTGKIFPIYRDRKPDDVIQTISPEVYRKRMRQQILQTLLHEIGPVVDSEILVNAFEILEGSLLHAEKYPHPILGIRLLFEDRLPLEISIGVYFIRNIN